MFKLKLTPLAFSLLFAPSFAFIAAAQNQTAPPEIGTARVATWKDDKKAAFLLMFDDGWPSHWQVAVPELQKRGMIGTFYIVPEKGEYKKFEKKWLEDVLQTGMVLANHTLTHNGFQGQEDTNKELGDTTRYILEKVPGKNPRLISFGLPGVKDYDYGGVPLADYLKKYNLVSRPDFKGHGATYHLKKLEEYVALADKAIASGGMEYVVYHGLERITPDWKYQDMWAVKQDIFLPFLDALQERRDRGDLWITDHISQHKYQKQRENATLETLEKSARQIRLSLKTTTDPELYDAPLTLVAQVPTSWTKCLIEQKGAKISATAQKGILMFDALPDGQPIVITPAS